MDSTTKTYEINHLDSTKALAEDLAARVMDALIKSSLQKPYVIYLIGNLGAGKTTFSQFFIRFFLPGERVKSPTFSLVETYDLPQYRGQDISLYHLDLYRLCDAEELDYLGLDEALSQKSILLIEWPEKGIGEIPDANLEIALSYLPEQNQRFAKLSW